MTSITEQSNCTDAILQAARASNLVLFVGAGVSMGTPTNLPSWRDFNRLVVESLGQAAAPVVTQELATQAIATVLRRHQEKKLPPEYQAQVLAELLGEEYFEVLRNLDSNRPNDSHLTIAWLARLGCVRAVVTSNFDRALEAAFEAVGVPVNVCYRAEDFVNYAGELELSGGLGPFSLLKLHGSAHDPTTVIDTLAQRKRGLSVAILDCLRALLRSSHWLFLGYSGADLEAERSYLLLLPEAENAVGFTWLARSGTPLCSAVTELAHAYDGRAKIVSGDLPGWLGQFAACVSEEPCAWIGRRSALAGPSRSAALSALDAAVRAWATSLGSERCALALSCLVEACSEPLAAAALAAELVDVVSAKPVTLFKASVLNKFGLIVASLSQHAEALKHFDDAIEIAVLAADRDMCDLVQGNRALSLEALGRVDEARKAHDFALAGYERRGDPGLLSFGLLNRSMHSLRQQQLDEAQDFARKALDWAKIAGDERSRASALFNLAKIELARGEPAMAKQAFLEVESVFTRLGDEHGACAAIGERADASLELGQLDEAKQLLLNALRMNERIGRDENRGAVLESLGRLEQCRGDHLAALGRFKQARDCFRSLGDPIREADAMRSTAHAALSAGSHQSRRTLESARALAEEALALVDGRNAAVAARAHAVIGLASIRLEDWARAERAYRLLAPLQAALGDRRGVAAALQDLGTVLVRQQRDSEAADTCDEATRLLRELDDVDNLERCDVVKQAALLNQRVTALSDEGRRASTRESGYAIARGLLDLYPDLVALYAKLGARPLAALCCESAEIIAKAFNRLDEGDAWSLRAADLYRAIRRDEDERGDFSRTDDVLAD